MQGSAGAGTFDTTGGNDNKPADERTSPQWINNNNYLNNEQQKQNAQLICYELYTREWTLNAIAGLLGNMTNESTVNPGIHERGGSGFGLIQWTPASVLTNELSQLGLSGDNDPINQLECIDAELTDYKNVFRVYYKNTQYPLYYVDDFPHSTESPEFLARTYQVSRERNLNIEAAEARKNSAKQWYAYLYDYYYYFQNGGTPYGEGSEEKTSQNNVYESTMYIPKRKWYK